jgi:uncharacterized protein
LLTIDSVLLLFGVGMIAGFINVNAGGGSTLTLPTLIFLGLNSAMANGTNRIGVFLQTLTAVYSFKKEEYHQFKLSLKLALITLPGAIIGAFISLDLSNALFNKILGVIMIGIIIMMMVPRSKSQIQNISNKKITLGVFISMFFIGFYGGFIQVGVGFLLMATLNYLLKFDLVHTNMHKVFVVAVYTIPALLVFIISGNVNWGLGLSLAAGNSFGAWWAAKFVVRKGEKLIKIVLAAAVVIMSLKLWGIF